MCASRFLLVFTVWGNFVTLTGTAGFAQEAAAATPPARTVEVCVLAYRTGPDGKGIGSTHPTQITVGGQPDNKPRVAFVETEVTGTGDQWRSAGWAAAVTAAQLSNFDPRASQVSIAFEGWLDGPSAGGLITVGILAAARGDTPRADAAMTGTINPDGTIGPVGGIVHKISGAAAAGKKLVLIPLDSRFQFDQGLNKNVDLVEHGRKLGVDVRQVGDVYVAYRLLTGKELPRPEMPVDLRIPADTSEMAKLKFRVWSNHYESALEKINKLDAELAENEDTPGFLEKGAELSVRAQKLMNEGELSAAHDDILFAAVNAYMAMEHARCASTYRSGDMQATIDRVKNNAWLKSEMELVAGLLKARAPRTLDELSEYIGACNVFIHALAFQQMADDLLANLPQSDDDDVVYPPTAEAAQDQIIAWLNLQVVRDCLDFMSLKRGQPIPEGLALGPIADFYRRAAEANHAVFEALVVQPTANRVGAAPDRVRAMLNDKDYTFALSQALFKVRGRLGEYFDAEPARSYAQLAIALSLYLQESDLIAKYYSLSAELDDNMQITAVKSEGALNNWLQFSEEQARRNMGELVRVGIDPTTCLQLYEVGHMARMRDLDGKLDAIDYLWQANLLANVMRQIATLPVAAKAP